MITKAKTNYFEEEYNKLRGWIELMDSETEISNKTEITEIVVKMMEKIKSEVEDNVERNAELSKKLIQKEKEE